MDRSLFWKCKTFFSFQICFNLSTIITIELSIFLNQTQLFRVKVHIELSSSKTPQIWKKKIDIGKVCHLEWQNVLAFYVNNTNKTAWIEVVAESIGSEISNRTSNCIKLFKSIQSDLSSEFQKFELLIWWNCQLPDILSMMFHENVIWMHINLLVVQGEEHAFHECAWMGKRQLA